jgi:hypothetical protein
MTELDEEVRLLRQRIEQTGRARVLAEHERDMAQAAARQAAQQLQDEFGVTSLEEAKTQLVRLEDEARAECRRVESALAVVEGG